MKKAGNPLALVVDADKVNPMGGEQESITTRPSAATLGLPAVIDLGHLVGIGLVPTEDAGRKLVRRWPPELRVRGVGRRLLFFRDRVLRFLEGESQGGARV